MKWIVFLFLPFAIANAGELSLSNGRTLVDVNITVGDKSRVYIEHSSGVAWYQISEFTDGSRAIIESDPVFISSKDSDVPTAEEIEWTAKLRRSYSVTDDGKLVSCSDPGYMQIKGKVLSVVGDNMVLVMMNRTTVALDNIPAEQLADDDRFTVMGIESGRYQYTAASGALNTVRKFSALPPLSTKDVHRFGLASFLEYRQEKEEVSRRAREQRRLEKEAEDRAMSEGARKIAEGKRALRQSNRSSVIGR